MGPAFGWRFVLCGTLPLAAGLLFAVLRLVLGADLQEPLFLKYFVIFLALFSAAVIFPGRLLRHRPDAGQTPFWQTLLMLLVVAPVGLFLLLLCSDLMASVLLGKAFGAPALLPMFPALGGLLSYLAGETGLALGMSPYLLVWLWWSLTALAFAAGNLLFERDTVVKTLLVLAALLAVYVLLFILMIGHVPVGYDGLGQLSVELSARRISRSLGLVTLLYFLLQAGLCLFVIYRRPATQSVV